MSRQIRRTPYSSSGTHQMSSPPPRTSPGVHDYTHHVASSNNSLPSLPSVAGVSAQERIVKGLVDKMIAKMPSYSGLTLSALEIDESLLQVHEALLQLSRHCVNIIVWSLCEILDKFQKKYIGSETSLDILESEIYIVRVLAVILGFRSNLSAESHTPATEDVQPSIPPTLPPKYSNASLRYNSESTLVEPPPLEDNVAKYALVVMLGFIRRSGPTKADALRAIGKLDTLDALHEFEAYEQDASSLQTTRHFPSTFPRATSQPSGSFRMSHTNNHSISSFVSGSSTIFSHPATSTSTVATYIPTASAVRLSSFQQNASALVTRLAGQVIYYISASNWPMVFSRVRNRIHYLAANMNEEAQDIVDLRLVTHSATDKNRLVQVLQELSSLLVNMKTDAQSAVAIALRTVVWNWIEDFPHEFVEVTQSSRRRLDGQPERVFDLLYALVDPANHTSKRILWPTLAMLLAISPERFKVAEAAWNGTLKFGKKHNNLLEHLHSALTTQSKLGDVAMLCYNDICRAAFYLPPHAENTVLRSIAPDLADELKSRLMNPPASSRSFYDSVEPIDVNMYADALVAILRYHPMIALVGVLPACLEIERSAAVKLCVVKALTILVTEASKFPWQPQLDGTIYGFVAPKLRAIILDLRGPSGGHALLRPLSAKDGPANHPNDDRKELALSLHSLWRLDLGFFLTDMKQEEYHPFMSCSIRSFQPSTETSLQISTLRTFGTLLAVLNNPLDPHYDAVRDYMCYAGAPILQAGAESLLRVIDDLEDNKRCTNMILAFLSQLANHNVEGQTAWRIGENRAIALAVVEIALLVSLASPNLENCSLAAKGLRMLAMAEQHLNSPLPSENMSEQALSRISALEMIGDPKTIVLGRVEFQKRIRGIVGPGATPSIIGVAFWKECYYRWMTLKPIVTGNAARSSAELTVGSSDASLSGTLTPDEMQMMWENLTLLLASGGATCLNDDPMYSVPQEYRLPLRPGVTDQEHTDLVKRFIGELVDMLSSSWVPARTAARDALGLDVSPKLFPILFEHLDTLITDTIGAGAVVEAFGPRDQYMTTFVDQIISVFKLIMDRVSDADALSIKVDIGENMKALAGFIHRGERSTAGSRLKARFCTLVDNLLEKRKTLRIHQESIVRNTLLDMIADWVLEYSNEWSEDELAYKEQLRAQNDARLAALKTCVNLIENLRLQAHDGSTGSDTAHVVSRQFHRYFTIFLMALPPRNKEADAALESDQLSQHSGLGAKQEALIQELVVSGIANMLHANTDAGTKHVLLLGYKDDSRLRTIFAHVFWRVLRRGTKFDHLDGLTQANRKSKLCEMVKESEIIAQAIIDVCPMSEIDTIIPVLLNIYDTRRALMSLLKMLIHRQVEMTTSDTELFRSNDMCSRLLSAFARLHGYNYLRTILSPLITLMLELPPGMGYELDPAKLRPEETQEENAESLKMITKAFLTVISESVNAIPSIIREVCRIIEDAVTAVWPESRYAAVGAFIFLRFIVPAIVAPETVDIELPRNDPRGLTMRRGLLLVAKIIQNLANNIMFGKEAHMTMLNPFLQDNIVPVTRFHSDILKGAPGESAQNPEEWLGTSYDETDTIVLHRFFQKHADKVGKVLLSISRKTNSHEVARTSGKRTWDSICELLVEMGSAMESPTLVDKPSSQHQMFRAFMIKNGHRNTDSVREIFQPTITLKDSKALFVLALSKIDVETVDLELLMTHIFKTIREKTGFEEPFDVILDCTAFTSTSEVPISWCKLCMEHLPSDLRQNFDTAYILNSNATAHKFLRKLYHVCLDSRFAKHVIALSSIADLTVHVHPASLTLMSYTTALESEVYTAYECHQHQRNQLRIPVVVQVGLSHIRITSAKAQPIYPSLSCKTVEVITLADIGDISIVSSRGDATEFIVRRSVNSHTLTFSSTERDEIIKVIRSAKGRLKSSHSLIASERRPRLADVSASLLNVGLLNVCDGDESLRLAAYNLLFAVCSHLNYDENPLVPLRGPFIPSNTATFILPFSERLASFVPQLTLDLITEFGMGLEKVSTAQKITCLQYLNPWVKNMALFANPTHALFEPTSGKLKDSIRALIDITVKFPDIYPSMQRWVWTELGRHDGLLLNIVLEELMRAAIDGGLGSTRCEQIADMLIAMSSINVRAKVLVKLRRVLNKASLKSTQSLTLSPSWNEISALARLALVSGYSSRLAVQNQLFVPEIAHLITMLCATGSLSVKSTIYAMTINLLQSLHIARTEDGPATELKKLLDYASQAETLQQFGLTHAHMSSEYASVEYPPDQITIPALEGITQLLMQALTHGASSVGLLNVWRSRWMSLVAATAFQICPYIQYRAFVVLGLLASSDAAEVDDDLLYQMLVAFKNALTTTTTVDPSGPAAATSMLRCIARVIRGLSPDSRYLAQVFWLAVALLQSTYLPLYGEAAQLLEVTLEAMADQGLFKEHRMSTVLLDARQPLSDITTQLDSVMGLSFDAGFSFSLASVIFRGVRPPTLRPVAVGLLRTVLRIAAESSAQQMEIDSDAIPVPLDHDVLGYFLALLPFASTSALYRELLKEARVGTRWWPSLSSDEEADDDIAVPIVSPELFGFSAEDNNIPLLVISFLFAMLNSYQGSEQQKEFLFGLLAQLAQKYPDLCASAVVHYLTNPRSEWLLSNLTETFVGSPKTAASVQTLFRIAMTSPAWSAATSSTMATQGDDTSAGQRTPHYRALEELDMHALSGTWQFLPRADASKVLQWIPQLVDAIIE